MKTTMKPTTLLTSTLLAFGLTHGVAHAVDIPVTQDVMTSSFFQGTNTVRGYATENNRPVMRVSTDGAFGNAGAETIYLSFAHDFAAYTSPVVATLTLQSTEGGFGADASAATPFVVSAHGVDANPLTSITDDTNPTGTVSWLAFYNNQILPADNAAWTSENGFGTVTFDVSALVNSWISGGNSIHTIALTGKNDTSGNSFLHGFLNNDNGGTSMGYTFLSISAVPEPDTYALMLAGLVGIGLQARRQRKQ